MVGEYEPGHFDVFHLTGHATHEDKKPCFLTEDEYGNRVDSHAEDIADALNFPLPSLIFLSGGAVPSMAEELLKMGAKVASLLDCGIDYLNMKKFSGGDRLMNLI